MEGRPREYVAARMRAMGYELFDGPKGRYWAPAKLVMPITGSDESKATVLVPTEAVP